MHEFAKNNRFFSFFLGKNGVKASLPNISTL